MKKNPPTALTETSETITIIAIVSLFEISAKPVNLLPEELKEYFLTSAVFTSDKETSPV